MKITTIRIPDEQYNDLQNFLAEKEMKLSGAVRLGLRKIMQEND